MPPFPQRQPPQTLVGRWRAESGEQKAASRKQQAARRARQNPQTPAPRARVPLWQPALAGLPMETWLANLSAPPGPPRARSKLRPAEILLFWVWPKWVWPEWDGLCAPVGRAGREWPREKAQSGRRTQLSVVVRWFVRAFVRRSLVRSCVRSFARTLSVKARAQKSRQFQGQLAGSKA